MVNLEVHAVFTQHYYASDRCEVEDAHRVNAETAHDHDFDLCGLGLYRTMEVNVCEQKGSIALIHTLVAAPGDHAMLISNSNIGLFLRHINMMRPSALRGCSLVHCLTRHGPRRR